MIGVNGSEKIDDYVGIIEDCDFRNCYTRRPSQKIINEYYKYDTLFKKNIAFHAINIRDCRGLDKIYTQTDDDNSTNLSDECSDSTNTSNPDKNVDTKESLTAVGAIGASLVGGTAGAVFGPLGIAIGSTLGYN